MAVGGTWGQAGTDHQVRNMFLSGGGNEDDYDNSLWLHNFVDIKTIWLYTLHNWLKTYVNWVVRTILWNE